MLINNVNGTRCAGTIAKNSEFYIEIAKFVQAYTTIVSHPNEFLAEIKEPEIDEKNDKLTWVQFQKIMMSCDFGFKNSPSSDDLLVWFNYALQIGSIDANEKRIASVDEVADAQKHYYNFVDEAKDKAETEYLRQKRVTEMRNREVAEVDNKISAMKAGNYACFVMMMFFVAFACFGIVSFFAENAVANAIGSIIPISKKHYIGAVIITVISLILFAVFDKIYIKTKRNYKELSVASETLFARVDDTYIIEKRLKRKLDNLTKDLKTVQAELADKTKRWDVRANIDKLKTTNKYYQKFSENEMEIDGQKAFENEEKNALSAEDFAPVKLTKEQEENLHSVSKEVIRLEGEFDVDAYNEKFENTKQEKQEEQEKQEKTEEEKQTQKEEELIDSIDYIKSILGFNNDIEEERKKQEKEEQEKL